jgi:hypothetical protein
MPREWIKWHFHDLRIRPTHYTIASYWLESWALELEGSMEGSFWYLVKRQDENQNFVKCEAMASSFAMASPEPCRFVRLTQTVTNQNGNDYLPVFEFVIFSD